MSNAMISLIGFFPAMLYAFLAYRLVGDQKVLTASRVVLCLMAGFMTAVPSYYMQKAIDPWIDPDYTTWGDTMLVAFGSVSLVEEVIKVAMTCVMIRWLNPPKALDLLVIAAAIGMGFAGVENILYSRDLGWETGLFRALTAIPAHFCFAVFSVYFLGMAWRTKTTMKYMGQGLLLAFWFHGWYDTFILQRVSDYALLIALVILTLCIFMSYMMYKRMKKKDEARVMPTSELQEHTS